MNLGQILVISYLWVNFEQVAFFRFILYDGNFHLQIFPNPITVAEHSGLIIVSSI